MEETLAPTLEKLLQRKVLKAVISNGTALGDNYLSAIYCIDVTLEKDNGKSQEIRHLFLKIYPNHSSRQQYNNEMNMFHTEMAIYKHLIPKLKDMVKERGQEDLFIKIFAPFVAGQAEDFSSYTSENLQKCAEKPFQVWDNFVLMEDVRKTLNYKMVDRQKGLDVDHFSKIMEALAKLHSMSWAYKVKKGIDSLENSEFPFMKLTIRPEVQKVWQVMISDSINKSLGIYETHLGKDSEIYRGTEKMLDFMMECTLTFFGSGENIAERRKNAENYLRIPPEQVENEIQWNVAIHGDCWVNNFMFLYDETTSKPKDALIVDLQFTRETCPTVDLNYLIYSSTDADFRNHHLDSMIQHYHDTFNNYCSLLGVKTLPGFSFQEIKRRMHTTKLYGYILAMLLLPVFLQDSAEAKDMDAMEEGADMSNFFANASENDIINDKYVTRLLDVGKDMYQDGVI